MTETRTWLRWIWRQLTSMRVALMLLLLLAVAAVPGSIFPQRAHDPTGVNEILESYPTAGVWLDRLGFFNVFSSPWFMAIYTLLFVSLIGCILPRLVHHVRALRSAPPRVPGKLTRFENYRQLTSSSSPEEVYQALRRRIGRRYRVAITPQGLTAERGYARESGNILFHLALIGILVSFAWGQLATYSAQVIVAEGESFANSVVDFDSYEAGSLVQSGSLNPFTVRLDQLESSFTLAGRPESFIADVTITPAGGEPFAAQISPNDPVILDGTSVFLSGNGYAPVIEVRDADGNVAFSGAVPFLPQDDVYTSSGVIKVPDVTSGDQLGFAGQLLPTAYDDGQTLRSLHPQATNPVLLLELWRGDLGLDSGVPQNVYQLETEDMTQVTDAAGSPTVLVLTPGDTVQLPDGLGEITFVELARFASLDVRHDPSLTWLLWTTIAAIVGLMGSLFIPRRRLWVWAVASDGGCRVEAAALARGEDAGLAAELDQILAALPGKAPE